MHDGKQISAFGGRTYFLRRASAGREFCIACHEVCSCGGRHAEIVSTANFGNKYTETDASALLDPMSLDCIGCHDGSLGRERMLDIGRIVDLLGYVADRPPIASEKCQQLIQYLEPLQKIRR